MFISDSVQWSVRLPATGELSARTYDNIGRLQTKNGSAQESVGGCILGGFLQSDESGHWAAPGVDFEENGQNSLVRCGNDAPRAEAKES